MRKQKKRTILLGVLVALVSIAAAFMTYTGPQNRTTTTTKTVYTDYGYWARHENYAGECAPYQYPAHDCIICSWRGSPGSPCGSATYSVKLGTDAKKVTVTTALPEATVSGSMACSKPGLAGWCTGGVSLNLSASEPVFGYLITGIESNIAGMLCSTNAASISCSWTSVPQGVTALDFWALSTFGDTSIKDSATLRFDSVPPSVAVSLPPIDGAEGWYVSEIDAGVIASDATSGFANAMISDNGGAAQAIPLHLGEGIHSLVLAGQDVAGNAASANGYAQIDITAPVITPSLSVANPNGNNGWYISSLDASMTGTDALSGFDKATIFVNGGAAPSGTVHLGEGVHSLIFSGADVAGNVASITRTASIDLTAPSVSSSFSTASPDGESGWYVSELDISVSGSDALSGLDAATISVDGGAAQSGPVHLTEGVHSLVFTSVDVAGNSTSLSQAVPIDLTGPVLTPSLSISLPDGENGWYVIRPDAQSTGSDTLSGLARLGVEVDGGAELTVPTTIPEGIHTLTFRAVDTAGNITEHSVTVRIDITVPSSNFTSHADNEVVLGVVELRGESSDGLSGLSSSGEISFDNGVTWQPTSLDASGAWASSWDTKTLPNGHYTLLMRATDNAGNKEHTARLTLFVGNEPPHVRVNPTSWTIWSNGNLIVSPNGIEISSVTVTIRDRDGRYPKRVFEYSPNNIPEQISWDRRFGDGTLAPSGNYIVEAVACDIFGNCGSDKSTISIPFIAPPVLSQPTFTPTPTAPPTLTTESTKMIAPVGVPTAYTLAPTPVPVVAEAVEMPIEEEKAETPTWHLTTLTGLILAFALSALLDPRPRALRNISAVLTRWTK